MQIGESRAPAKLLLESIKRYDPESDAYIPNYYLLMPNDTGLFGLLPFTVVLSLASEIEKDKLTQMLIDLSEARGPMGNEKAQDLANFMVDRVEFLLNTCLLLGDLNIDAFPLLILSQVPPAKPEA